MKIRKKRILAIAAAAGWLAVLLLLLIITKQLQLNALFINQYEVTGVDVSHYQGSIDWENFQGQGIGFAYIKATEGSSYMDDRFPANWKAAGETEIPVGAYHFFSFDSPARSQAEWFISVAGDLSGKLVPAVDIEYYAEKQTDPPEVEETVASLRELLRILEERYQKKPVIYTTYPVYHRYIKGRFPDYPLWIRNVYYPPGLDVGDVWAFWQYSDTARRNGKIY